MFEDPKDSVPPMLQPFIDSLPEAGDNTGKLVNQADVSWSCVYDCLRAMAHKVQGSNLGHDTKRPLARHK